MNIILLFIASGLTLIWGVAHLFPTKSVVKGFGEISVDNKHIITMEWVIEGVTLIFLGITIAVIAMLDPVSWIAQIVSLLIAVFLIVLAVISTVTGFRVNFFPFKLCPFIFTASAILIIAGVFF